MLTLLASVFVAGFVGSLHCVGMCGPFAALNPTWKTTAYYQLGRLLAYALVGLLAGAAGWMLELGGEGLGIRHIATGLAGITMILMGIRGLLGWHGILARLVPAIGRLVSRTTVKLRRTPHRGALMLGLLAVIMPCGWLYAFAMTALSTGTLIGGTSVMITFWLGTLPALLATAALARHIIPRLGSRVPQIMYLLLIAVGVFTLTQRVPSLDGSLPSHCATHP